MSPGNPELTQSVLDFKKWLQSDNAQKHLQKIQNEKKEVKEIMTKLYSLDKNSAEFDELILYGLLPYFKTRKAKRVSTFPVFMDIKQFFENYQYSDSDWKIIAKMVYDLAYRFQQHPDKISTWINEFVSDNIHSRSLQCGSISPILFSINDSYPIVNNRVIRTYNEFSKSLGWRDLMSQKLEDYIENITRCNKLIDTLGDNIFRNLAVFDLFCWWYDSYKQKRGREDDQEEEQEEDEGNKVVDRFLNREIIYPEFLSSLQVESISKFEPHKLKNPDTITVKDIITNCSAGRWLLPKFQRYFDWSRGDVKDFLTSIFSDYYVGSLLLWAVETEPPLDTMPVSGVMLEGQDGYRIDAIILDGQQRITSLYYGIKAPEIKLKGNSRPVYFYIDFQNFLRGGDSKDNIRVLDVRLSHDESIARLLFPFYELEDYRKWVNDAENSMRKSSPNHLEKIVDIRRIIDDKLSHFLNQFEIPYVILPHSMQIDQVTDIFEKINTTGIVLDVFDLLIARLSKYGIELRDLWDDTVRQYPKIASYRQNKKMPIYILQAISMCYNKTSSCKREDLLNIHKNIFHKSDLLFEDLWVEMSRYTDAAISKLENLRDGYGVKDNTELPFSPMIAILAALLKEIDSLENKADCYNKLNRWYWSSVFSNAYSGTVDTQLTNDFREIKAWFADDSKIPKTLVDAARYVIARIDLRNVRKTSSAIYRGVLSLLALEGAYDFDTGLALENARKNDKHHLFPKSTFRDCAEVNSILNMTWMSDTTNRKIIGAKKPSKYITEFLKEEKYGGNEQKFIEVLQTHLISKDAYDCMLADDFDGFVGQREKEIKRKIAEVIIGSGPVDTPAPTTVMISPETPFSNRMLYEDMIRSCSHYIHWIDKYFSIEGLRILVDSVDKKNVNEIKILMSNEKVDERFRSRFKDFRDQMKSAGIDCALRVIVNSEVKRAFHDRWIISQNKSFNIPSPDILARNQFSEIKETFNKPPFDEWWNKSIDILVDWNRLQQTKGS